MRLFKRKDEAPGKALTATGDIPAALAEGWRPVQLLGSGPRDRIQNIYNVAQGASYSWLYSRSPALRMVVDKITKDVAALQLRLYEEVSESERQPQPDHPAALSLRYPNESTPSDQFVREVVKDYLIHDNAYALLAPRAPDELYLFSLPAFMMEVQGSNLFRVENYRMWTQGAWTTAGAWGGGGTPQDFVPSQILHWHGEHPQDRRVGLSRLDTLRGVLAEDAALQQAVVELANAGLQEPVWVYRPVEAEPINDTAIARREEDLTNRMRRRNSKVLYMTEGEEMRSFGITPHDAEMMEQRKWAVAQVANAYDVPPGKVGLEPPSAEAEDDYNKDVLTALGKSLCSTLDHRLLVGVYDWPEGCWAFNIDERLMGNARIQTLVSATGRAVMVTNEARGKLNLPPVDGGDELVTPLNVVVGEKPSPQVMPPQDPNKPPQDGSYRLEQGQTPIASENAGKALYGLPSASESPSSAAPASGEPLPQFHAGRAGDIERQHRHIDATQAAVQRHYNRLERSLRDKSLKRKAESVDWERWDREFTADLNRALRGIVSSEGDVYAMKLAAAHAFDMTRVRNYLLAMAAGAAGAINDTIRGEIDELGLDDAMARAPQHVANSGASLGAGATFFARDEAAKQSPDYEGRVKMWVADTDRHAEFDGDTVAVGEDWPAGFAPGSAPGCRCTASIS